MKYHILHDWVPGKPLAESLWERMCVGCVTVCLWVCVHTLLCVGGEGGWVYTPKCGWGLVVLGMKKNRRSCIEYHSSEWPPFARGCKDLTGAMMDGYSPYQSSHLPHKPSG